MARNCGGWRAGGLWTTHSVVLPASRHPRRQAAARRKGGRTPDRTTYKVRAGNKPEDRECARNVDPAHAPVASRPGDRIIGPPCCDRSQPVLAPSGQADAAGQCLLMWAKLKCHEGGCYFRMRTSEEIGHSS